MNSDLKRSCFVFMETGLDWYSVMCPLTSSSDNFQTFKKTRSTDRCDNSENSDSGLSIGSPYSELSGNSGNSDITNLCSRCSINLHNLHDGYHDSRVAIISESFGNCTASKMLPHSLIEEDEHKVSCWPCDETTNWDHNYLLATDDIDVEANQNVRYFNSGENKENWKDELKIASDSTSVLKRKASNINGLRSSKSKVSQDVKKVCKNFSGFKDDDSALSTELNVDCSQNYFSKLIDDEGKTNSFVLSHQRKLQLVDNKYNSVDLFNILPSVFENSVLYSCSNNEADSGEDVESAEICNHDTEFEIFAGFTTKSIINEQFVNCEAGSTETNVPNAIHKKNSTDKNGKLGEVDEVFRFPRKKKSSLKGICRWDDCVDHVPSRTKLIEHLQTKHVISQTFSGTFICLWNGCKVYGRPSCSLSFLERHVLSHTGDKPYRCIVDECGRRFKSQLMLQRHVNQHFKFSKETSDGTVDITSKSIRRNGQKLKYRRQQYSVRNRVDAFDAGVMIQLQYTLVQMAQRSEMISVNMMNSKEFLNVTFQPKVIGRRREEDGETKYLIRWYPFNSLEDEWLCKSEITKSKNVPIWDLPTSVQRVFWSTILPKRSMSIHQSRKIKPQSSDPL